MNQDLRVLIIEDNESDALLSIRQLEKAGYKTTHERVETSEQIKKALKENTWDIVFSDFQLPSLNAHETFSIFKTFNLKIPFILISGAIGEEAAVEFIKKGVSDYVMKTHMDKLPQVVKNELEALRKLIEEEQITLQQENLLSQAKMSAFGEMASNFFKSNLEHLLTLHSIKQSQLARDTGISKQSISDWINKDSVINIQQALKLTKYFKITVEELFFCNLKMISSDELSLEDEYLKKIQSPLFIVGLESGYMFANQSFCDLVGFSQYELNSRLFADLIHPEDISQAQLIRLRMKADSNYVQANQDLRFLSSEKVFKWATSVNVKCTVDKKMFSFIYPIESAKPEEFFPEKVHVKYTLLKNLEQIQNNTIFEKLKFIDQVDSEHYIFTDINAYKCLLRSLFYQFQLIEFESDKKEVILKSRVEENRVVLSATINYKINSKKPELSRVKKVASLVGAEVSENSAANIYSFYISFLRK
jgi:CheY-like chemotaxis protein